MLNDYVKFARYYGLGIWPGGMDMLTTADENKTVARTYFEEVWNQGRVDLLDELYASSMLASDYDSPQQLKNRILWWHRAAPGLKFTILDMAAEDNRVVTHWRVDVTYTVPPDPPPSCQFLPLGKPVSWKGFELMRFMGGKIMSREHIDGWTDLLVETSAIPLLKP